MRRKSIIYTVIALAVAMFFYSTAFLCSQSPYETNQDDLKERTGQNFEDWSDNLDDLDKMKAELDRIEKESGLRYGNWNKEEIDALKEKILKERDEKEKELQEAMMAKSGKSAEELQSMREADLAVLKLRVELEKRTGKNLDKLDYWGLLEAEKFLNEKDRLRAELEAKTGQSFEGWSFDNMRKFAANLETEKEVAETVKDIEKTEVAEEDEESITSGPAETMAVSSDKDILGGIWVGELKKTKITGTVTLVYDDERGTVIVDVNELWAWQLEEPPSTLKFELAKSNGGYIRSDIPESTVATDITSDAFLNENIFVMTITGKLGEKDFYQKFTGKLEEENLLKGTYEFTLMLADPGGIEYGEWWAERQ